MAISLRSGADTTDKSGMKTRKQEYRDPALLWGKLETFQREQETAQVQWNRRDTLRNGSYVPRSAAKAFAATATPSPIDITKSSPWVTRNNASTPVTLLNQSITTDDRMCIPLKHLQASLDSSFATLGFAPGESQSMKLHSHTLTRSERAPTESLGVDHREKISMRISIRENQEDAAQVRRSKESRKEFIDIGGGVEVSQGMGDSSNTSPNNGQTLPALASSAPAHRSRESSPPSPRNNPKKPSKAVFPSATAAAEEGGRCQYRPGDAAKRRSVIGPFVERTHARSSERSTSLPSIVEGKTNRVSKFLEHETSLYGGTLQLEQRGAAKERPKLVATDRPDWSQRSKEAVETRHTLNFFHRTDKGGEPETERPRKRSIVLESRIMAPLVDGKRDSQRKHSGPQDDHMIAEAVQIIKEEERLKRRKSVIGFFKKR